MVDPLWLSSVRLSDHTIRRRVSFLSGIIRLRSGAVLGFVKTTKDNVRSENSLARSRPQFKDGTIYECLQKH